MKRVGDDQRVTIRADIDSNPQSFIGEETVQDYRGQSLTLRVFRIDRVEPIEIQSAEGVERWWIIDATAKIIDIRQADAG